MAQLYRSDIVSLELNKYQLIFGQPLNEKERHEVLEQLERDAAEYLQGLEYKDPNSVKAIAKDKTYLNSRGDVIAPNSSRTTT